MKILFFSDLHAHNHEQFSTRLPNGRNSRFQDCLDIIEQAKLVCREHSVDQVIFLGDCFHSRTKVDVDVFVSTFWAFEQLACEVGLTMLVGNHDQYTKVGKTFSIQGFSHFADIVYQPKLWHPVNSMTDPGVRIAACPHMSDVSEMKEFIAKAIDYKADLFLFHQALKEGTVGPYDSTVHAELSVNDLPVCGDDGIKYCIGGDFHKRQFFGPGNRVHYCGSPLQLTFGERGETKAFTLLDTKDWSIQTIETSAPKFFILDSPGDMENMALNPVKDFIRLRVLPEKALEAFSLKTKYPRIQVEVISEEKQVLQRVDKDVVTNDRSLLKAYIDQQKIADGETYLASGLDLLLGAEV